MIWEFFSKRFTQFIVEPLREQFQIEIYDKVPSTYYKQGLFTLAAMIDCSCCLAYFDLKKYTFIHIIQHFSADPIMYRKSNFVFVLPMTTWKKNHPQK